MTRNNDETVAHCAGKALDAPSPGLSYDRMHSLSKECVLLLVSKKRTGETVAYCAEKAVDAPSSGLFYYRLRPHNIECVLLS